MIKWSAVCKFYQHQVLNKKCEIPVSNGLLHVAGEGTARPTDDSGEQQQNTEDQEAEKHEDEPQEKSNNIN